MIDSGKHNVIGIRVNAIDYDAAVAKILTAAKQREQLAVTALAVHGVMTGALDATHKHRLNAFELVVPDGQPVRWALRILHGISLPDRVYGPELMLRTCQQAAEQQVPIFLFGGTLELLETLQGRLLQRFPNLRIAGTAASRFRQLQPEEKQEVIDAIHSSGAQITFVGLGCPRQEVWAYEFREQLSMPLLAVGAAFNFHAGLLDQAPPQLQRMGLEWFYRLLKEPRRLWKRYLYLNPLYLSMLFCQRTGLRRFDPDATQPPSQEMLYG